MIKNPLISPAAALALALGLTGCASSPERSDPQLARATNSIEMAEESGGREYGDAALDRAQRKLAAAERAQASGDHDVAIRLSTEAQLDAELAAAQAGHGKAKDALAEIRASIDTLNEELARSEGVSR